jgi:hypothetical protein
MRPRTGSSEKQVPRTSSDGELSVPIRCPVEIIEVLKLAVACLNDLHE